MKFETNTLYLVNQTAAQQWRPFELYIYDISPNGLYINYKLQNDEKLQWELVEKLEKEFTIRDVLRKL